MEMVTSWSEEGYAKGMVQGMAEVLLRVCGQRFGPVPPELAARVRALDQPSLEALTAAILDFTSPADLRRWMGPRRGGRPRGPAPRT